MDGQALDPPDDGGHDEAEEAANGGRWWKPLPDTVLVADGIDLDAADPALADTGRRQCVAEKVAGGRCGAPAIGGAILCAVHDGRADPALGGQARAAKLRGSQEAQDQAVALRRLGTRAVVAQALAEKATEVRRAVHLLADQAASGDVASAKALIPWLNQALGLPTASVELVQPDPTDVQSLSTSQLAALVAQGERTLRAVE